MIGKWLSSFSISVLFYMMIGMLMMSLKIMSVIWCDGLVCLVVLVIVIMLLRFMIVLVIMIVFMVFYSWLVGLMLLCVLVVGVISLMLIYSSSSLLLNFRNGMLSSVIVNVINVICNRIVLVVF